MRRKPSPSFQKESGCQRHVFKFFDRIDFRIVNFILNFLLPLWPSSQVRPHQAEKNHQDLTEIFISPSEMRILTLLIRKLCHQQQLMTPKLYEKHQNRWICVASNLGAKYRVGIQIRLPDWNSRHDYQHSQIKNHRIHQVIHTMLKLYKARV